MMLVPNFERVTALSPAVLPPTEFQDSRYQAAIKRLVQRILAKQDRLPSSMRRGKRRDNSENPLLRSNTLRTYFKSLEIFKFYMVARWGREIDPANITLNMAQEYAYWLAGRWAGDPRQAPDVRPYMMAARGEDWVTLYTAVAQICVVQDRGEADIQQIRAALPISVQEAWTPLSPTSGMPVWAALHRRLGDLVRFSHAVQRVPSVKVLRGSRKSMWTAEERDPLLYRYVVVPQAPLGTKSVATHLSALSAIWNEFTQKTDQGPAILNFNPWAKLYSEFSQSADAERKNREASGDIDIITTPIVQAMFRACKGDSLDDRRDYLALHILTYTGLRAEELVGLLRSDMKSIDGVLNIVIAGKGDKIRAIPVFSEIRAAFERLTAKIEEMAKETHVNEKGAKDFTYEARYAQGLQQDDAPLVFSLVRWGQNKRSDDGRLDSKEPMDTSGLRAILRKVAARARVKEVSTGKIRPLNEREIDKIHPHSFRRYAATAAAKASVPMYDIKSLLGHETLETTDRYIKISAQKSMAFSVGIYNMLNRRAPLSADELLKLSASPKSPIDQPEIEEWDPDYLGAEVIESTGQAPLPAEVPRETVSSPTWAYTFGAEEFKAMLPRGIRAKDFSPTVKRAEEIALSKMAAAEAKNDYTALEGARKELAMARAKHLYVTFRLGEKSKLAWWAGRANTWKDRQLAPVPSSAQISPELGADAGLIEELKRLYDELWQSAGPSAAAALVTWVGEYVDTVTPTFERAMVEREDHWVAFDEDAHAGERIVRQHLTEQIVAWFERWGGRAYWSGYREAQQRGGYGIVAMETLPEWFFVPDPLLSLPEPERKQMRQWFEKLVGIRPSELRTQALLDALAEHARVFAVKMQEFEQIQKAEGKDSVHVRQLIEELRRDEASFSDVAVMAFPEVKSELSATYIAQKAETPTIGAIREIVVRELQARGIKIEGGAKVINLLPRDAKAHPMFSPSLVQFDDRDTITHTNEQKKTWFESYGSDSECVIRRAIRAIWERRKAKKLWASHPYMIRQWDIWLATLIPCPGEIEARMRGMGWQVPKTIDQVVEGSRRLWAGAVEEARSNLGYETTRTVPSDVTRAFWGRDLEGFNSLAKQGHMTSVVVRSGDVGPGQGLPDDALALFDPTLSSVDPLSKPAIEPSDSDIARMSEAERYRILTEREDRRRLVEKGIERMWTQAARKPGADSLPLDAESFSLACQTTADYIAFCWAGATGAYRTALLRGAAKLAAEVPTHVALVASPRLHLELTTDDGRRLCIMPETASPQAGAPVEVIDLEGAELRPNASKRWTDPRPDWPRWPGYPGIDPNDEGSWVVDSLPWPIDDPNVPITLRRLGYESCMNAYAQSKRSRARANPRHIPPKWQGGDQRATPNMGPGMRAMPSPIDAIFAAAWDA